MSVKTPEVFKINGLPMLIDYEKVVLAPYTLL